MPAPNPTIARNQYSSWMGLVYVFNLIVGTGALTLPAVFARAGWGLGLAAIIFLAFISFVTVTFVIETISCANALMHWKRLGLLKREKCITDEECNDDISEDSFEIDSNLERHPLMSRMPRFYEIDHQVELGEMASMFFNTAGRSVFYLCLCIYLYGDLSIYCAAVSESLVDITCYKPLNYTDNFTLPCFPQQETSISRISVYNLCLSAFFCFMGPFAFFNVQKTKYLQMITSFLRWLAFSIMIGIASWRLAVMGPQAQPPVAQISGVPGLFGACVYSFMCHHSIPSLVAPIANKKSLKKLLSCDYFLICLFYIVLALTGTFAFANLEDLYTLNFLPSPDSSVMTLAHYFLALFPVFTLSASFPIIAITLRNNLQTLFLDNSRIESYNFFMRKLCFPLMAIVPPFLVALGARSLSGLVGFTGSYAGTGVQYLVPIGLVYSARKQCGSIPALRHENQFQSPFKSNLWLIFILLWSIACVVLVSVNLFAPSK
uniref:Putative amino acid transporter n=1 Tax=Xenopsylla cheopis TaxID=163159 RepID=A0A6M2DYN0_XENCH